ncbi:MAG: Glyoxalase/bleomycin resistance protein/dioxygenase, partial [Acidobacteria bacterium]|nr:Glyoxalase/bleomycin resistance protein/dioxygenase [Acidobacteriota bacterium]
MRDDVTTLFNNFDRGRISRRQLLMALGAAAALRPAAAFAQGQCGGARAGTPDCDPTPAKPPFAATGWKTVLLDHLSCQVADYPKEAAYYAALMNWKIRSDDG